MSYRCCHPLLLIVLLCLLLAACGGNAPRVELTAEPTSILRAWRAQRRTLTPPPTPQPISLLHATPTPTMTLTPIPIPTNTLEPTAIPTAIDTPPPSPTSTPIVTNRSVSLTLAAETIPYMHGSVPIAFYVPDGWDVQARKLGVIDVVHDSAELHISILRNEQPRVCLTTKCYPTSEELPKEENAFYAPGLEQLVFRRQSDTQTILFSNRFGDVLTAYGYDLSFTLTAKDKAELSEAVIKDAIQLIRSLWVSAALDAAQLPLEQIAPEDVWSTKQFSSTNQLWAARSYAFNGVEAEKHELARFPYGKQRQLFIVTRNDGTQNWHVLDKWENTGLGSGSYEPLQWTPDTLYFSYQGIPDGGGCGQFGYGSDLWRLGLETGVVRRILPDQGGSFSPFFDRLATITPDGFRVIQLGSRRERHYTAESIFSDNIVELQFTPNARSLILLLRHENHPDCRPVMQELIRVDFATESATSLATHYGAPLTFLEWTGNRDVLFADAVEQLWTLDVQSGAFVESSQSP